MHARGRAAVHSMDAVNKRPMRTSPQGANGGYSGNGCPLCSIARQARRSGGELGPLHGLTQTTEKYGERDEPFKTRTTSDYSNTWAAAHTMTSAAAAGRAGTFSARSPTSYSGASRRAGPRTTGGTAYPAHGGVARRQGAPESQSSGSSAWLDARVCRHRRSGARPTSLQGQTDRQIIGRTDTATPDR